jgi:GTP-binding protein
MKYQQAEFLTSAAKLTQLPSDIGGEVAFAGCSNAGKSSAINVITNINNLARTSKTPGRTQLINLFRLDDQHRLVDLPGYGYAKVPASVKRNWQSVLSNYLHTRQCLVGLVLVMDIRHPLKEFDTNLLDWCKQEQLAVHILLTKSDKLKRGASKIALMKVGEVIKTEGYPATLQLFSASKKVGVEEVRLQLDKWLD